MRAPLIRLDNLRRRRSSQNATWIFLGQGSNVLLQAGYFVLLARLLGVKEYGVFAGVFATVNFLSPYSALGGGMLFMRYVTADRARAATYWGNSLATTTLGTAVIAIGLFFAGPVLTKTHDPLIFVVLAIANCLFSQIANVGSVVFQTFEKMRWTALLTLSSSLARLLILVIMRLTLHHATALQWSVAVLIASGCAAGLTVALVRAEIGPAAFQPALMLSRAREGLGFSFAGTTQATYNDVDKVMLSHYGLNRENGFYTLAYRVIDAATTPIVALNDAVLPRFFRLGGAGISNVTGLVFKSAGASVVVGSLIAVATLALAPLIPYLVGHDFAGVLTALRWLCWIPLLRGIHRASGSALTGSGHQNLRTCCQLIVAIGNVLLNLWWIPLYGWIGAAWSSVVSDAFLALLNTLMLFWACKHDARRSVASMSKSEAYS
jgi:O-antigen/teichoic acid export membrane protein